MTWNNRRRRRKKIANNGTNLNPSNVSLSLSLHRTLADRNRSLNQTKMSRVHFLIKAIEISTSEIELKDVPVLTLMSFYI